METLQIYQTQSGPPELTQAQWRQGSFKVVMHLILSESEFVHISIQVCPKKLPASLERS